MSRQHHEARPGQPGLFCCLLALLVAALTAAVHAQEPPTTMVSDVIYRADGTPAQGSLVVSWPAFSTAGGHAVAAGNLGVAIGEGGAVALALAPNEGATPGGTYYRVVLRLDDGTTATEYWVVPAAGPVTIAQIRSAVVPASVAAQMASRSYVDSTFVRRTGEETIAGVKTFAASPLVPTPTASGHAASKGYVDAVAGSGGGGGEGAVIRLPPDGSSQTIHGALRVQGEVAADVTATFMGAAGQTADILSVQDAALSTHFRVDAAGRAAARTLESPETGISVASRGALGDGAADDTAAFNAAIADCIAADYTWAIIFNARPSRGCIIVVPDGVYRITEKVTLPGNKSIHLKTMSPKGARLVWDGAGSYMFRLAQGFRSVIFDGLVLHQGGIEIEGGVRGGPYIFRHGLITETPDYAIRTLGESVINFRFQNQAFTENAGDIYVGYGASDLWVIDHSSFIRSSKTNLVFYGTGLSARDSNFESRNIDDPANMNQPFIRIGPASGLIDMVRLRFGNEVSGDGALITTAPPREAIVLGDLDTVSTTGSIGRLTITDSHFLGTNGTPSSTSADVAIRINVPVAQVRVVNPKVGPKYNTAFIDDAYYTAAGTSGAAANTFGNAVVHPSFSGARQFPVFVNGGAGWVVDESNARTAAYERRGSRNLLLDTEDLAASASWTKTGVTVTKNAAGPDGVANQAYTVEKTATSSSLNALVAPTGAAAGASLVGSAWLKAGTMRFARISISDTTTNRAVTSSFGPIIELSDEWRRYWVAGAHVSGNAARLHIRPGYDGQTDTGGTILVYAPQLEVGETPSQYVANAATTRAQQQFNALTLGQKYIGYGTAAPASGRYEVGDVIFNTAPASGGVMGWTNITAGSPGTWRSFGMVSTHATEKQLALDLVNSAAYQQGGAALNFSHLAGTLATAQIGDAQVSAAKLADGAAAGAKLGNPAVGSKGGVEAVSCAGTEKIRAIGLDGIPVCAADQIGTLPAQSKSFTLLSPATADSGWLQAQFPVASTITRVSCSVSGGTSVTVNLNKRSEATPNTSGADVLSAGLVCDADSQTSCASGCDVNTINSAGITARQLLALTISAVSGTVDALRVHVEYSLD